MRPIPDEAIALIKLSEDLRLRAYPDPGNLPPKGDGTPWTIGYGETGPDIKPGVVWTRQQAEERFAVAIATRIEAVDRLVKAPVTDNQRGALVSLVYNIGAAAFKSSTLLRLLNDGKHSLAADQFPRWNKSNGKVLNGLTVRRAAERDLFLKKD